MDDLENENIARKWLDAFNRHDLRSILKLYDENAQHYSPKLKIRKPETNGLISGKIALNEWWKDAFIRIPSLEYREKNLVISKDAVFIEYDRIASGEEDMKIGEVLEIKKGLIVFSRVYHG